MKVLILIPMIVFSPPSIAGNKVGNGGDVVICEDEKTVLDLYEAKDRMQAVIDPGLQVKHLDLVKERLTLLQKVAPKLGAQYLRRLESIQKEIEFKKEMEITNVEDSLHAVLGKGCRVVQIALRKGDVAIDEKRFLIQEELWSQLNELNKAALLLHEVIYEHMFKLGSYDSRAARRFVARLLSKDFEKEDSKSFWQFIGSLNVPIYP